MIFPLFAFFANPFNDLTMQSIAREYANVNPSMPKSYWDYDNLTLEWSPQENYEIIKKVGRGKYSEVFHGIDVPSGLYVVIKALKPIKRKKIQREVSILQNLSGGTNIIQLLDIVRDPIVFLGLILE
jgi:casein kinase II subunit alpha